MAFGLPRWFDAEWKQQRMEEITLNLTAKEVEYNNLVKEFNNELARQQNEIDARLIAARKESDKELEVIRTKNYTERVAMVNDLRNIEAQVVALKKEKENVEALIEEKKSQFEKMSTVVSEAAAAKVKAAEDRAKAAETTVTQLIAMLEKVAPKVDLKDLSVNVKAKCGKE